MAEVEALIRSKVRIPWVTAAVIERPRVAAALEDALAGRRFLLLVASAGSGKTTAAVQLLRSRGDAAAWLTLGEGDDTPGRFVTYLAAAVEGMDAEAAGRTRRLLMDGLAPEDCAALLGEALPPGATLVIDDLHHVEARASVLRVLRAFLDATTEGSLVVLLSRRLVHLDMSRDILAGRVGTVSEPELAFRADEITALLAARGLSASATDIEASSGGWAAGIVFDALRGARPAGTAMPPEDPFFAYLGSEVLGALPADLRDTVIGSALLDTVSPHGLEALLGADASEGLFEAICAQHLPGTLEPDGLRYHPRFREFLLALLRRERPEAVPALTARYARVLLAEGHLEEAVDYLLAAGEAPEAEPIVERAAPALMRRGDWDKVLNWCAALGEDALSRRHALRGAQVRALLMSRRQDDVASLVDTMRHTGEFGRLVAQAPDVAAWAVWALHGAGDWPAVRDLAPPAASSRRARVMRYILDVGTSPDPPQPFAGEELDRPWPLHVALQSAFYYRGAFAEVERLSWAAAERGPVTATLAEIYRVAVLCARGDLADARALLESAAPRIRASRFIEFWQQVEAELAFAEGDRDTGLRLIRAARATSRQNGYRVADRAVFPVIEAKMLVRAGLLPEAVELLEITRDWCSRRGLACFREWADTWLGAALLGLGRDPEPVARLLGAAIRGMEGAERRLELPAANVFLAEAAWRSGDEAAHDAAADAAYSASLDIGTLGPLLGALDEMPDVLARRIDAAGPGDDGWRLLAFGGRRPDTRSSLEGAHVVVRSLGRPAIEVGGDELTISTPKAIELASVLARAGARGASRAALAEDLFRGSSDGANHLRQLIHRLRRALPAGVGLVSSEGRLAWLPAQEVVADDLVLESLLVRARSGIGADRLRTLDAALHLADRGPYLPGVDGEAAARRRDELAVLVSEGRREYAKALLAAGRLAEAEAAAREAVADDPYREDGWQLLMRSQAAAAGPASVVPTFLECRRALGEVGLHPSAETTRLLDRLRNA